MSETTFRSVEAQPEVTEGTTNTEVVEKSVEDPTPSEDTLEYVEPGKSSETILKAMEIGDTASILPDEVKESLGEVEQLIDEMVSSRKLKPTTESYKKVLDEVKEQMEIEPEMEPYEALERIAGVVKSWRKLSFIGDPKEKRRIFMKLAKAGSAGEMNRMLFDEMEKHEVWNL